MPNARFLADGWDSSKCTPAPSATPGPVAAPRSGSGLVDKLALTAGTAEKDYRIDTDRVVLTGVSMGGAGTWSLAAADPKHWSAIVPISHGADTASAAKLVGLPCWCFHGAADRIVSPQQSREMVETFTKAGGRPLYQSRSSRSYEVRVGPAS